jgi:large subunit ribosomal protein L10
MDKIQKTKTVENLKDSFEESESIVVTHYIGLNTAELTDLRVQVRDLGARFCVAKK